jgi:hypothetical protein
VNTAKQIAYKKSARPIATCLVAILVAGLVQVADGQEQSKPFVLKPASPSALEPVTPAALYPTAREQALIPQPLPAGQGAAGTVTPGAIVPVNPRPGETIYIAPDGRVVRPTHIYRGGRAYRVAPQPKTATANNKNKPPRPPRPKIDYSRAPVQPAIPPRLAPLQAPKVVAKTRVVDGAPLIRQEAVVSADRPVKKQQPTTRSKPAPPTNNTPWLAGVRRMMDGNRSAPAPRQSQCPNCRKSQASAQVASRPSSRDRK